MQHLKDKSSVVYVADPVASVRLMMASILRALGYTSVVAVQSLQEALPQIMAKPPAWLITSLYAEDKVNALHVLDIARRQRVLGNMLVSIFVSSAEDMFLPRAFSLGLLSRHKKPFTKNEFSSSIENVLRLSGDQGWRATRVAASYLREFLRDADRLDALVGFETALSQAFPEDVELLLPLAEACFQAGDIQRARSYLWQAAQRDPLLETRIDEILFRQGEGVKDEWKAVRPGVCVLVDPDSSVRHTNREALRACGAKAIHVFDSGDEAWGWLKANEAPDLLVMEWKLPRVSGPLLLQRMRSLGFYRTTVIVNSSLVGRKDQPLLAEMGVRSVLEKPSKRNDLLGCIAWAAGQAKTPTEQAEREHSIRSKLASGAQEEAAHELRAYLATALPSDPIAKSLEAEMAFALGDFAAAKELGMAAIQLGAKSVTTLNVLGKTLMQLREFAAALQVFARANDVSPNSIERLCAIAETQNELGQTINALSSLEKATEIDAENQATINASVNIGLATGNASLVTGMIEKVRPNDTILAYVNNRAVAHARAGNFNEGISLYNNALDAIPKDKEHLRSVVLYNLSLAHIRNADGEAALATLNTLSKPSNGIDEALGAKVGSLLTRTKAAVAAGLPVKLNETLDKKEKQGQQRYARLAKRLRPNGVATTGAIFCCHGLFKETEPANELVDVLMSNPPRIGAA